MQDVRASIFRTKIINKRLCLYSGTYRAGRSKQVSVSSGKPLVGSKFQISYAT